MNFTWFKLKSNYIALLLIIIVAADGDDSCYLSEIIHGVPNAIDYKSATLIKDIEFEDCVNECCNDTECAMAGIHKDYCVQSACLQDPCIRTYSPDVTAQFVIVTRPYLNNTSSTNLSDNDTTSSVNDRVNQTDTSQTDTSQTDTSQTDTSQTSSSENVNVMTATAGDDRNNDNVANDENNQNESGDVEDSGNNQNDSGYVEDSGNNQSSEPVKEQLQEKDGGEEPTDNVTDDSTDEANDEPKQSSSGSEENGSKETISEESIMANDTSTDGSTSSDESTEYSSNEEEGEVSNICDPECGEHANCEEVNTHWQCECLEGYSRNNGSCVEEAVTCKADSCQEHETCNVIDNMIKCSCQNGYKLDGDECTEVTCNSVECPEHATCAVTDNNPHCFCEKDYVAQGEFCRSDIKCTVEPKNEGCPENEHCQRVNDKLQCFCKPGKLRAAGTGDCTADAAAITLSTDDVTVTLPAQSATLSVTVTPAHAKNRNYYTYKWEQKSSPEGGESVVEGLTTSRAKISKLVAGEYVFQLTVVGVHNEYQSKVITLVVEAEAHPNNPPIAVIKPAGKQSFKLPADFSLNGIDSSDDDKIVSYKWTIEARPIPSNDHFQLTGENADTLHVLVGEGEGEFKFKLEVKDKGGLKGSAIKSVFILAEDDFPPSAKVSAPQALTLPKNTVVLYGNESKDDHEIVRWEWQKSADSPKTGDMTGTTTSTLTLSNLVEGTYTFTITVFDKKDQKSSASTTVTVRPAEKGPPVAKAGSNKELVMPDTSTELDGAESTSPLGPVLYKWEQVSGSTEITLKNGNTSHLQISGLSVGTYRFRLTVTDKKNVTDSDEVTVTVKEDDNQPPQAILGPNMKIYMPNTAVDIDGSNSTDDNRIVKWTWSRSANSPALGQVVGRSDQEPVLKLCDLIVGVYRFTLTVSDEKLETSSASITVTVENNPNSNNIVQVYLFEDASNFTQERLNSLTNILMVPFSTAKERSVRKWKLKTIRVATINNEIVVYFYGEDENGKVMEGAPLVQHLRQTVYGKVLGFNFDVIDTTTCSNTCSGHGTCTDSSRLCECDKFWMENFFRASAGRQFSNCEWSKIYFGITVVVILVGCLIVMYIVWYVFSLRNNQIRRKKKYKLLEEETGRGINNDSSDESDFFKLKSRKTASNGFNTANVLSNNNINVKSDKRK